MCDDLRLASELWAGRARRCEAASTAAVGSSGSARGIGRPDRAGACPSEAEVPTRSHSEMVPKTDRFHYGPLQLIQVVKIP